MRKRHWYYVLNGRAVEGSRRFVTYLLSGKSRYG